MHNKLNLLSLFFVFATFLGTTMNINTHVFADSRSGPYSQYPTDDKKYECQTGPFEGFFVSSVECFVA